MRQIQIGIFVLGLISFLAAAFFIGQELGDTLWKIGVAAMLIDLVLMKVWPLAPRSEISASTPATARHAA
jgi:hypothetical protein